MPSNIARNVGVNAARAAALLRRCALLARAAKLRHPTVRSKAGAGFGFAVSWWLGGVLLASAVFVAFEALRGWCALRACGIKTKL